MFLVKIYTDGLDPDGVDTKRFGQLLRILYHLQARYNGAEFVTGCVNKLMKFLPQILESATLLQKHASGQKLSTMWPHSPYAAQVINDPNLPLTYFPGSDLCQLLLDEDQAMTMRAHMTTISWAGRYVRKCFALKFEVDSN